MKYYQTPQAGSNLFRFQNRELVCSKAGIQPKRKREDRHAGKTMKYHPTPNERQNSFLVVRRSRYFVSYRILLYPAVSCCIMLGPAVSAVSCHILLYPAVSCVSCRILPLPSVSCRILPYPAVSCRILPYPAVSCRIVPYAAASCRVLPYPAVSCRILAYRIHVSGKP